METEGKRILVNYLTDIADTFRSITGETDTISAVLRFWEHGIFL